MTQLNSFKILKDVYDPQSGTLNTTPSNSQEILQAVYDESAHALKVNIAGGIPTALGDLTDVDTSTASNGQVLTYASGTWLPIDIPGGGGAVDSVNGQVGIVILDTGDITSILDNRYVTDAQLTILGNTSGTNTGDQDISGIAINTTAISNLTTADVAEVTDKNYITDAHLTILGNTSGTNTGDQDLSAYALTVNVPVNLNDLTDINAGSPTDTQVLTYDTATSKWIAADAGGASVSLWEAGTGLESIIMPNATDPNTANGINALAVGRGANAFGDYGIAMGSFAGADARYGIALGAYALVQAEGSVAIGYGKWNESLRVNGKYSFNISAMQSGDSYHVSGEYSGIFTGSDNNIGSDYSVIAGGTLNDIVVNSDYSVIIGGNTNIVNAWNPYSVIIGGNTNINNGTYTTILSGNAITADQDNMVYLPATRYTPTDTAPPAPEKGTIYFKDTDAKPQYYDGTAWQDFGGVSLWEAGTGVESIVMPNTTTANTADGDYALVTGRASEATGDYSVAMGLVAIATGVYSFAIGRGVTSGGSYSVAMGYNSDVAGAYSFGMGLDNNVAGAYSVGMGYSNNVSGDYSVGMGYSNIISVDKSFILGTESIINSAYSGILGGDTNTINITSPYSVILGGELNIVAHEKTAIIGLTSFTTLASDTVYVPKLETVGDGEGVIMSSPDGTRFKVTVDNSGNVVSTAV